MQREKSRNHEPSPSRFCRRSLPSSRALGRNPRRQNIASCNFNTFSAPSGYTLSEVNGVSDDGTVVGQLVDNKTLESVAFTYSASGVFTEYTAPKSSATWMYGRNGSGINAGSYQDSAYPGHVHGFLLQGGQLPPSTIPRPPIRGCSTSTNWESRSAAIQRRRIRNQGIHARQRRPTPPSLIPKRNNLCPWP